MTRIERYHLVLTEQTARIERDGGSTCVEALVIAIERDSHGEPSTVWCDRRIHDLATAIDGWACGGAVVTKLTRTS